MDTKLMWYLIGYFYSCFLVNTADRIIRVYESGEVLACGKDGEPEPIQKLQDLVNKYVHNVFPVFEIHRYCSLIAGSIR